MSIYPRLILHPSLEQAFLAAEKFVDLKGDPLGRFKWIRRWPDGFCFLDYLEPMGSHTGSDFHPILDMVSGSFSFVRKLVIDGLRSHPYDPSKWEKYRWMADYFNAVIAEYPEAKVDPIQVDEVCPEVSVKL